MCLLKGGRVGWNKYAYYRDILPTQGGRWHWTVNYTGTQSFIAPWLTHWLKNFTTWILIGWFIKLSVQTFLPLILIFRRGNFVYHHWRCTSIYRPLSLDSCKGCRKYVDVMTGEKLSPIWLAYMKLVYWLVRKGFRRGGIVF